MHPAGRGQSRGSPLLVITASGFRLVAESILRSYILATLTEIVWKSCCIVERGHSTARDISPISAKSANCRRDPCTKQHDCAGEISAYQRRRISTIAAGAEDQRALIHGFRAID